MMRTCLRTRKTGDRRFLQFFGKMGEGGREADGWVEGSVKAAVHRHMHTYHEALADGWCGRIGLPRQDAHKTRRSLVFDKAKICPYIENIRRIKGYGMLLANNDSMNLLS